ncbi:hypothetical protein ACLB2K_068232 [Fragaria x ananassa]
MALWVRILDLPVKFFKDFTAAKIGKILGDVVKVDPLTIGQSRGKFARVCIEIDLSKPLRPVVEVQNIAYHVVYEGISMICFECGCFGHPKDKCPSIVTAKVDVSSHQDPSEVENVPNAQSEVEMHASEDIVKEDMGPWMLMTCRNKKKNGNSGRSKNLNASGSRFSVLQEEEINEKVPNVENDADMPFGDTPNIVKLWNNFQDKKKKTIDYGYWKAVKASQSGPKISHLFFADDLILFTEASSLQASLHKTCLDNFCALSGQTGCSSLMNKMESATLSHIFRECNSTADALAKCNISHELGLVYFDSPPAHAANAFLDDLCAVSKAKRASNCFSI